MFITLGLGLLTSRLLLQALGIEDYGLYNVVGGIIAMFGFISGAMTNTTSRFITFFLGKGDNSMLQNVFSMSFIIHLAIAGIILILGETLGLWYLYNKLVVPDGRFVAAFWVYQCSILSAIVNILYVPFNSAIVAHEKMNAFAYISIFDSVLKCCIAIVLLYYCKDRLVLYGLLMLLITFIDIVIYIIYCRIHFIETRIKWFWDSSLFREMFGFAGWSLFGNFSYIFYSQGVNLILNAFCGPAVNAARGVAVQVEGIVRQFAANVQTSLNPQIIKSYADNNKDRMISLIFASSRYCFYLLFLLALPIVIETNYLLELWLKNVPDHTVNFVRITLLMVTLDGLSNPLFTANLATGKVRIYQITLSIISYSLMPVTYLAMKYTLVPEVVFVCLFICKICEQIARIFIARKQIGMSIKSYLFNIIVPDLTVALVSSILPIVTYLFMPTNFMSLVVVCMSSIISVLLTVFLIGINANERELAIMLIKKKILKKF